MPRDAKHLTKHKWKPGQSGNPRGRPLSPIPDALRKMTRQSYRRIIMAICKGNVDEVIRIGSDPKSSFLEAAVAKCSVEAMKKGDYDTIEKIVARVLGKVPDKIEFTGRTTNTNLNTAMAAVTDEELASRLKRIRESVG